MEPEEAVDDGDKEMFESLKEMVRQKDLLENEVKELKSQKTVSDAEVKRLTEELERYINKKIFIDCIKISINI